MAAHESGHVVVCAHELHQFVGVGSLHGSQILPIEVIANAQQGLSIVELALLYPELGRRFLEIDTCVHDLVPLLRL